jgi:hypothetical protein
MPPMESLTQAHFSSWDDQNGAHDLPLAIPTLNFI